MMFAAFPPVSLDERLIAARPGTFDFTRVLFLDIDGVLHPEMPTEMPRFCYVANFLRSLRRVDPMARVPVVISSDWRFHFPLDDIRLRMPLDLAQQIVGVTPSHFGMPDGNRESEIRDWMGQHAPDGDWLAIDDRAHWFSPGCPNLFHVPSLRDGGHGGLTDAMCGLLEARLGILMGVTAPETPG